MHMASIRYQDLFKFRSVWMGVAILWVMLYHSELNLSLVSDWKFFGYGGVDIFFWASGLGCFYSLQKNASPSAFLARRMKRILPAYYVILALWLFLQIAVYHTSITPLEILSNILCTGVFTGLPNQFNWYVSGVWISYLSAPFLFSFINNSSRLRRFLLLFLLFLGSFTFLNSGWNAMLTSTRLPLFYLGMLFAKEAQEHDTIKGTSLIGCFVFSIVGAVILLFCRSFANEALTNLGMWWYPFFLITPGLCFALSLLCMWLQRFFSWPVTLLAGIGSCSFELYLTHLTVFTIIVYLRESGIYQPNNTFWCLTFLGCCLFAILLRKLMRLLDFLLRPRRTIESLNQSV